MKKRYSLGKIDDLEITAAPSAAGGLALLWAVFGLLGWKLFRLKPAAALTGGLLAAILHFLSELWHQGGHARAARLTGFPMTGVHLIGVLGASKYPRDEPPLPDEVHVQRAMGGPRASALLAALAGLLALLTRRAGGIPFMLATLAALENLLVFTLGAFLPMPFMETDGGTLLRHRDGFRKQMIVIQE
jgi:hypothetical protein